MRKLQFFLPTYGCATVGTGEMGWSVKSWMDPPWTNNLSSFFPIRGEAATAASLKDAESREREIAMTSKVILAKDDMERRRGGGQHRTVVPAQLQLVTVMAVFLT